MDGFSDSKSEGERAERSRAPSPSANEPEAEEEACFFCGTVPKGSTLLEGVEGCICSSCVFALSARLAEEARDPAASIEPVQRLQDEDFLGEDGELPAHEYQNRADLAAAYLELGRRKMALKELFGALDSALICQDWPFALKMIGRLRDAADSPTLRDRIHETLALHVPQD
jgi:hypothetical protein